MTRLILALPSPFACSRRCRPRGAQAAPVAEIVTLPPRPRRDRSRLPRRRPATGPCCAAAGFLSRRLPRRGRPLDRPCRMGRHCPGRSRGRTRSWPTPAVRSPSSGSSTGQPPMRHAPCSGRWAIDRLPTTMAVTMRRTDRLFDLSRSCATGASTAPGHGRAAGGFDPHDLARHGDADASGLPVEGERGVGYMLRAPVTLPPLTLTRDELEALELGMQLSSPRPPTRSLARARR